MKFKDKTAKTIWGWRHGSTDESSSWWHWYPGKAAGEGWGRWVLKIMREVWIKLLDPVQLSSSHCGHSVRGLACKRFSLSLPLSLPLSSLCISFLLLCSLCKSTFQIYVYMYIYISKIFVGYQIMFWYTLTLYKVKIRINISVLLIIYRFFMEFQTISSIVLGKTKNINLWSLSYEQITRTYFLKKKKKILHYGTTV